MVDGARFASCVVVAGSASRPGLTRRSRIRVDGDTDEQQGVDRAVAEHAASDPVWQGVREFDAGENGDDGESGTVRTVVSAARTLENGRRATAVTTSTSCTSPLHLSTYCPLEAASNRQGCCN